MQGSIVWASFPVVELLMMDLRVTVGRLGNTGGVADIKFCDMFNTFNKITISPPEIKDSESRNAQVGIYSGRKNTGWSGTKNQRKYHGQPGQNLADHGDK
ncbi:hypothetical protein [Microbulbifer epialgicus]|uniref:Uncharacterized protein n=1 Tax=Microbulbifer epialgicus TaxID=393907 RepID=A0ABV4NX38_9GAMM